MTDVGNGGEFVKVSRSNCNKPQEIVIEGNYVPLVWHHIQKGMILLTYVPVL